MASTNKYGNIVKPCFLFKGIRHVTAIALSFRMVPWSPIWDALWADVFAQCL